MNKGARRCNRGGRRVVHAVAKDRVSAEALDGTSDLDVIPICSDRQSWDPARLKHDAKRLGRCLFGHQARVAADKSIVLLGWVGWRFGANRQALGDAAKFGRLDRVTRAWVGRSVERHELRRE